MEHIEKRTLEELIAMYSLHPEMRDIYVEGITDKLILERFLKKNKAADFQIIEVDSIDFSNSYHSNPELKRNNKRKIVFLSEEFEKQFASKINGLVCIADKDFDEIRGEITTNNYLLYTDYSGLELYFFNPQIIKIFYKSILHGFPITPRKTISELGKVLSDKFLIRLAIAIRGEIKDESKITDIKKSVSIDKATGTISFDTFSHLRKILNNAGLNKEFNIYTDLITLNKTKCTNDIRNYIRGHDFVRLFFLYVDKIKNDIKLSEEALERSLFQCMDYSELAKEPLFKIVLKKYT